MKQTDQKMENYKVVVLPFSDLSPGLADNLVARINAAAGREIAVKIEGGIKEMLWRADQADVGTVIFYGAKEQSLGKVTVRDMAAERQDGMQIDELVGYICSVYK